VTASAGDCGYLGRSPECEGTPAGVSFPASSPDVVAVGGTALSEKEGTWSSTVWSGTGGGCSSVFAAPAWQTEAGTWLATGCAAARLVADVAAVGDPRTGMAIYDSTPLRPGGPRFGWSIAGGTSVSAPVVAAEFALAGGGHAVTYPSRTLYSHIGDSEALYDVVTGTNGICGGALSCQTAAGYDGPSGVGVPLGLAAFSPSGIPINNLPPTLTGAAQRGQILTVAHGEWTNSPTEYGEQWQRCDRTGAACAPIPNARGNSYLLSVADIGSTIRVEEIASNSTGASSPVLSAPTKVVISKTRQRSRRGVRRAREP
jgi:hypothetical protein